jgi:V/A-type H+-transporting ATPase subunit E
MAKKKHANKETASIGDASPFVDEIGKSAGEEIDKIVSRAKRTAESRLDEAREAAKAETDQILAAAKARAELERRRIISDLSLEMKKVTLKARGELVEEALTQVRARLQKARGTPEYRETLKALIVEGILALDRRQVNVSVSSADAAMANEAFFKEVAAEYGQQVLITPAADLDEKTMGAIVRAADGSVLFDNTIDARMERLADELQLVVSREVFAPQAGPEASQDQPEA